MEHFVYFVDNWNLFTDIFYDHLVLFVLIWYIFSGLGITHQEKSGNPAPDPFVSWNVLKQSRLNATTTILDRIETFKKIGPKQKLQKSD
jgi:hypothetical protein